MKYLITGGSGQLGTELALLLKKKKRPFVSYNSDEMDILDGKKVETIIKIEKPTVVFHCAAYTAVDKAEDDGKELNWKVNVEGTENVARACKQMEIPFVFISTDYVFNGRSLEEIPEDVSPDPLNEYGKAKAAGEKRVEELIDNHYIIRTSWVFGEHGNNFVHTMQRLAKSHPELTVVNDQIGRPTWTYTLAAFMVHLVESNQPFGVYHLANDGSCSWYEFAEEILKKESVKIKPIPSEDFPQKAVRPQTSIMNLEKSKDTGFNIPHWKDALDQFLNSSNH